MGFSRFYLALMDCICRYDSPLRGITLAGEGPALTGLCFDRQAYAGLQGVEGWLPVFDDARRWLDVYFSGKVPSFTPRLELRGTPFRRDVWEILLKIPYGCTMTYGEIAGMMAAKRGLQRMSAQAVGGAVSHNPVALIVPCHRVIGASGALTGYAAGLDRKRFLLGLEGLCVED